MATLPRVFIIESLGFSDEKEDRFEGGILSRMLRLSGSEPEYMYLRTRRELEKAVALFEKSRFRYLHISCHGNRHGIALTLDNLSFDELGEILAPALKGRRVFFSSCSVTNAECAASLFSETGCLSVVGPYRKIDFDRATIFWLAFYHLMLRDEASAMKGQPIQETVSRLKDIFGVHMRYFTKSASASSGFRKVDL
ncbi:hypothetical protein [Janthinobacterium agaricidamnosum]|uniref:hypothetical protein n=1 Tax=Janthinobacterium agaricidamnosum TaxID=55508 RepID=UPI0005716A7E|nr:hypothetical protein [Janthinobacterium agaricidamnosum]